VIGNRLLARETGFVDLFARLERVVREKAIQEVGNHGDYPVTVSDESETQAWMKNEGRLAAKNVRHFDGCPMGLSDLRGERASMEGRISGLSYKSPFARRTKYRSSSSCILQEESVRTR
jgi:hypothetical protein